MVQVPVVNISHIDVQQHFLDQRMIGTIRGVGARHIIKLIQICET